MTIYLTSNVIMSKKQTRRVKRRKYFLSDTFFNVKRLLSNGSLAKVFQLSDNQVIIKDDNSERIYTNSPNLFNKNDKSIDTSVCREAPRHLKRCRYSRKEKKRIRSKKRRKISPSKNSNSQDDSASSSGSSSDLRSTSQHVNRHISSRLVEYTFYSVVNTAVAMDQGTTASALCRSFLALFLKLDENSVYSNYLSIWEKAGQKIIVLKGYNHKHLQYLAKEVRHIAVESNTLYKTTGQARVMLVLTAFGREEEMEEAFDDLCYLH